MSNNKLLPESQEFDSNTMGNASSLMGYSNTLPECPKMLPDGTILDYSDGATEETTWKDVDFPERVEGVESPKGMSLEESIFHEHAESKLTHSTPRHIQKHMTRVQMLASMTELPEATEPAEVVTFEKPAADPAPLRKWKVASRKIEMRVWRAHQTRLDERSAESRANKTRRRSVEVAFAAKKAKAPSKPLGHALAPTTQPANKGWAGGKSKQPTVHALPGFHTWRAKSKALAAGKN